MSLTILENYMIMKKLKFFIPFMLFLVFSCAMENSTEDQRWSKERANQWYKETGWLVGCNFIPSTAINQLEMFQEGSYDPQTIDKELGWAEGLGFNIVRVYLHYLPWQKDADGFKKRLNNFLEICEKHKIGVMFVLFDDCWYGNAQLGDQPDPVPGLHNSGWLQCPRFAEVMDQSVHPVLEQYTKDILTSFSDDERVLIWDLYNEPANNHQVEQIFPLLKKVVGWAREVDPKQPVTMGVWRFHQKGFLELNTFQLEHSDVITFHNYGSFESMKKDMANYKSFGRPVICTEYIARGNNNKFQTHLPLMKKENVGAINWGLVSGKTQTIFPWGHPLNDTTQEIWHHDIFYKDGKPYDSNEIKLIRKLMGK